MSLHYLLERLHAYRQTLYLRSKVKLFRKSGFSFYQPSSGWVIYRLYEEPIELLYFITPYGCLWTPLDPRNQDLIFLS